LEALFVQMDDALCWIWQRRVRGQSTITVVDQSYANFGETPEAELRRALFLGTTLQRTLQPAA
jgi:hypothetical protein